MGLVAKNQVFRFPLTQSKWCCCAKSSDGENINVTTEKQFDKCGLREVKDVSAETKLLLQLL